MGPGEEYNGGTWESTGRKSARAALSAEVVRREVVEEFLFWRSRDLRRSLRARNSESISDFENLAFIGEQRDDTHGSFTAWTLERVNLKEALDTRGPAHGRSFVGFLGRCIFWDRRALCALPPCSTGVPPIVAGH